MSAPRPRTTTAVPAQTTLFRVERPAEDSDDYWTPPWVFAQLDLSFDLDVAAPPGGIAWVPAERYFTEADNGLIQPWTGRVWMNPPYSNPTPWVDRFIAHENGVALLPTSTGAWFRRLWNADVGFVALDSMRFHTNAGAMRGAIPTRCWLVGAGDECRAAIARLGPCR
jgi:hypothetical protein